LAQQPDLVAITGDFITSHPYNRGLKNPYLTDLSSALNILSGHQSTIAVLGNHDHKIGVPFIHDALVAGHVTDLSNSVISIKQNASSLHFAGLDYNSDGILDYRALINNIPSAGAAIMLVHYPDLADQTASTKRFDLQISGHSHGGQVILPWFGPVYTPEGARKYPIGLYRISFTIQLKYLSYYLYTIYPIVTFPFPLYNCRTVQHVCDRFIGVLLMLF
jgi:predicted MPP superfamily phosphohydrolase